MGAEFFEDVFEMPVDGPGADAQRGSDLLIHIASAQAIEHLALSRTQLFHLRSHIAALERDKHLLKIFPNAAGDLPGRKRLSKGCVAEGSK